MDSSSMEYKIRVLLTAIPDLKGDPVKLCQAIKSKDIIPKSSIQLLCLILQEIFSEFWVEICQSTTVNDSSSIKFDLFCNTLMNLITKAANNKEAYILVKEIGLLLVQHVCDEDYTVYKIDLLSTLNELLAYIATKVRVSSLIITDKNGLKLLKGLIKAIKESGDYYLQVSAMEALFRVSNAAVRQKCASVWFKNDQVQRKFLNISSDQFEQDSRNFLLSLNATSTNSKVTSLSCKRIYIEKHELIKPFDYGYDHLWVDFNLGSSTLSILCLIDSHPQTQNSNDNWDIIVIPKQDVSKISIYDEQSSKCVEICTEKPLGELVIPKRKLQSHYIKMSFGYEQNVKQHVTRLFGQHLIQEEVVSSQQCLKSGRMSIPNSHISTYSTAHKLKHDHTPIINPKSVDQSSISTTNDTLSTSKQITKSRESNMKPASNIAASKVVNMVGPTKKFKVPLNIAVIKSPLQTIKHVDKQASSKVKPIPMEHNHPSNSVHSQGDCLNVDHTINSNAKKNVNKSASTKRQRKSLQLASENISKMFSHSKTTKDQAKTSNDDVINQANVQVEGIEPLPKAAKLEVPISNQIRHDIYDLKNTLTSEGSLISKGSDVSWMKRNKSYKTFRTYKQKMRNIREKPYKATNINNKPYKATKGNERTCQVTKGQGQPYKATKTKEQPYKATKSKERTYKATKSRENHSKTTKSNHKQTNQLTSSILKDLGNENPEIAKPKLSQQQQYEYRQDFIVEEKYKEPSNFGFNSEVQSLTKCHSVVMEDEQHIEKTQFVLSVDTQKTQVFQSQSQKSQEKSICWSSEGSQFEVNIKNSVFLQKAKPQCSTPSDVVNQECEKLWNRFKKDINESMQRVYTIQQQAFNTTLTDAENKLNGDIKAILDVIKSSRPHKNIGLLKQLYKMIRKLKLK